MKKTLLLALLASPFIAQAQQIPLYNEYYINPFVYNPALTGASGNSSVYLIHRNQWQDFPGAPITSALTFDTPIQKDKIGLGFMVSNDQTGIVNRTEVTAAISYRARISPQQSILFGLSGGVLDNRIDFTSIVADIPTEASIYGQTGRRTDPTATFGMAYQYNRFELGVSVPQLFAEQLPYINQIDSRTYYTLVRHYLGSVKYTIDVDKSRNITLSPLVLARTAAGAPVEVDVSALLNWANYGWAAVSYRSDLSIGFNLGIRYQGVAVGYVYEVPTTGAYSIAGSSSEILLGYTFGKIGNKGNTTETDDKLNRIMKKLDNIEQKTNMIGKRLDTLEDRVNRLQFTTADGLKREVNVGDIVVLKNVNFEFNSAKLTDRSYDVLDELIVFLTNNPTLKIKIIGHTDDVGTDEYNDKLSKDRAKTVYDYIQEGSGINKTRLSYEGYGKRKPLFESTSKRARDRNRRVEFKVIAK